MGIMSESTMQFLLNNGVAVLTLVAVGYGVYLLARVLIQGMDKMFTHVIVPVKEAALKHLADVEEYLKKTTSAINSLQGTLEKIDRKLPDDHR